MDSLLAEQVAYYRARAPEYLRTAAEGLPPDALLAAQREIPLALERFAPRGDVLELACGPGSWTPALARHACRLTAVDASPEMLELARAAVAGSPVEFVRADIFEWEPPRRFDVVFFGFWLSHVPPERFAEFWSLVGRCLAADGRVFFVDDGHRSEEELEWGEQSAMVRRRVGDGRSFRIVKVAHEPAALERALAELGWSVAVTPIEGTFYWGAGGRSR